MRLLPLGLALALAGPGQADEPQTHDLSYQVVGRWDWNLIGDPWRTLPETLELAGREVRFTQDERVLHVDHDGDGRPDLRLRQDEGRVELPASEEAPAYALRLRRDRDGWSWAPGGVLVGEVAGVTVRLVDLNGDGLHGGFGTDALVLGPSREASLFTSIASLDGELHCLELEEGPEGARLHSRPYVGPVAQLDARQHFTSNGQLSSAIFRSGTVYIDAARRRRATLVPVGTYELVSGRVTRGARTADIAPGRFEPFTLEGGERHEVTWGGPLHAEFTYRVQAGVLTVNPDVRYFDEAGAEYQAFAPVVKAPLIRVRSLKTGKQVQHGRLGGCCGGGYTAWRGNVPEGVELVVELEHERLLFGDIGGVGRADRRRE